MVISFSSFQCKRAHPPHLEDVIKIRERRERRIERMHIEKRSIGDIEPLRGTVSYLDYKFMPWDGSIVPQPVNYSVDEKTGKRFKVPMPDESEIIKMFKFYGVDINKIYQCPVCDVKASIRTLLPHLNNNQSGYMETVGSTDDITRVGVCEVHESHNWTFKQLGEWMKTLGY